MDDDDGENQDDSVNFYDNDSKKIDELEKGENVNYENRNSKEAIKSKHLNEKINKEELVVTTDELIGMPSMAGDGQNQLKRKSDHDLSPAIETETEVSYHIMSGMIMPKFLNR